MQIFWGNTLPTDHGLLIFEVKTRLQANRCIKRKVIHDYSLLNNARVAEEFRIQLHNRFEALGQHPFDTLEDQWTSLKTCIATSVKSAIPIRSKKKKVRFLSQPTIKIAGDLALKECSSTKPQRSCILRKRLRDGIKLDRHFLSESSRTDDCCSESE